MKPSLRIKLSLRQMFRKSEPPKDPLDQPLLQLTPKDVFTMRDSFSGGIHVFGEPGSAKTSCAGRAIAGAFLRSTPGYGGCVCVAKPEETALWRAYCQEHGRENSLIVFDRTRHFNFLQYEFSRKGADAANSVTDILMKILKTADMAAGQGEGKEGEKFWIKTTREMLLNTITVLYSATGTVTMDSIVGFINTMPTSEAMTHEQRLKQAQNFALRTLVRFATKPVHILPEHSRMRALTYWFQQFPAQPEKTRGSIKTSVLAELNRFTDGLLRECFCTTTDIVPEMAFNGAIIVLDFPTLTLNDEGVICQTIFKVMFQRAVESRNGLAKEFRERPVFLYADESHYFVSKYDDLFLSTCRGSRCATVFMTQSLPTYYGQLGQGNSSAAEAFLGKFSTKLFFLNSCPHSNKYASELIGRGIKTRKSQSTTTTTAMQTNRGGTETSTNQGWNRNDGSNETTGTQERIENLVEPSFFATALKTGSQRFNYQATAVWFKAGGNFAEPMPETNTNTLLVTFSQR